MNILSIQKSKLRRSLTLYFTNTEKEILSAGIGKNVETFCSQYST